MENPQSYGTAKLKGRVFFKPGAISGRFATFFRCGVIKLYTIDVPRSIFLLVFPIDEEFLMVFLISL